MQSSRRYGQLKLEGANPMAFVETDESHVSTWTPQEEVTAQTVGKAIKRYLEAATELANGRYQHLRDSLPEYLTNPGNCLVTLCTDGVVVRYENKTQEQRKSVVAVIRQPVRDVVALLSQRLVHIESSDAPFPLDESFGVELKLTAHTPSKGTSQDLIAARIWFQIKTVSSEQEDRPGSKPYCLLSVRNRVEFELHGVIGADTGVAELERPFIAHSSMRLVAGWECIEVFPGLDLSPWNADFAPLWAERDVLGAALVAHSREAQLSSLDPRASARRQYAALLSLFKSLLDSNPDREQVLQEFLQTNPVILCPTHVRMWPKLQLGAAVTDFVFRDANYEYLLVELERSTLRLFRRDGHTTADLTHAHGQIVDWKRYLEDNLQTVQRELGLIGITPNPNGLLVIGRSSSLSQRDRRKLQTMSVDSPRLRIMTYDDVYENAKAVFENLLGPMWDSGGTTQIYYPPPA
jgi:Domain of unknown function (DUF4263)